MNDARTGRDGALRLTVERRGDRSVIATSRSTLPLQIMAPLALDDPAAVISVLNPTGGILGGDRLDVDIVTCANAHAVLTTPSATRIYRADGDAAVQSVRLTLHPDSIIEWVPDHTIPFAGSAFRQRIDVSVAAGARLILVDAFSAGRVARKETWAFRLLESAVTIVDERGWRFHDRFVLRGRGETAGQRGERVAPSGLGFTEGAPYFATVVVAGAEAAETVGALKRACCETADARCALAPLARGGAIVRCLAPSAPALLDAVDAIWAAARRVLLGRPPLALRKG